MTLISRTQMLQLTDAELSGLFGRVARDLSAAEAGSPAWRDALISLENLRHEQAARCRTAQPKPAGPRF